MVETIYHMMFCIFYNHLIRPQRGEFMKRVDGRSIKGSTSAVVLVGLLGGFFFSSTNFINRWISVEGGHWIWTSSLRYPFMVMLLVILLGVFHGKEILKETIMLFRKHWIFWVIAGTIGHGMFYLSYSVGFSFVSGWVAATSYQFTLLILPLILLVFGKTIPKRGLWLLGMVFLGILMVNIEQTQALDARDVVRGFIPMFLAAILYPLGNQIVREAKNGGHTGFHIPDLSDTEVLQNPFAGVLLLAFGSLPFWAVAVSAVCMFTHPPLPSETQIFKVFVVAILAGVLGTSAYYFARQQLAITSYQVAAAESTQSSEVLFTIIGEVFFVSGTVVPGAIGIVGLVLVIFGLASWSAKNA